MADDNDLGAFEKVQQGGEDNEESFEQVSLLVFNFGDALYGLRLRDVDSVIPWRDPAAVPQGNVALSGVIQDHGRIIAVLQHPAGATGGGDAKASRIIVCETKRGLIGLPASATRHVGSVGVHAPPSPGELVDTEHGVLTYLEAAKLASSALAGRREAAREGVDR